MFVCAGGKWVTIQTARFRGDPYAVKSHSLKHSLPVAGIILALGSLVHAAPLGFTAAPAADAATQIEDKYGIHIVFKGNMNAQMPVTFSLADADASGARLQAVNALANAAGADFQKTYVVSKAPEGSTNVPAEQIDTNAIVAFPQTKLSAEDAVRRIAGADNAVVHISGPIGDTVTMSATSLSAKEAAREVAAQTHTQWKTFYAMTPRLQGHVLSGRVIDRTNGGSPIIEEPYVYYQKQAAPPPTSTTTAKGPQPSTPQEPGQPQVTGPQTAGNPFGYGPLPYGDPSSPYFYPYGFSNYAGNNPYAQNIYPGGPMGGSPYGYGGGGYDFSGGSGLGISNGYAPPIVFGGGY